MTATPDCEASQSDEKAKAAHSTLVSRNVTVAGHRTSVRLEPEMWNGLTEICRRERLSLHEVCTSIAMRKDENTSLTAAIRVFAMAYFRMAATEDGHVKAGHGYSNVIVGMPAAAVSSMARAAGPAPTMMMANGKIDNGTRRF